MKFQYDQSPNWFKRFIWSAVRKLDMGGLILRYYPKSILRNDGWFISFRERRPIDKNRMPIPWYTYSFITFIQPRLRPNMRIYEYGCGNSTIWFSKRVSEVVSVDDNQYWISQVSPYLPENCSVHFQEKKSEYVNSINGNNLFDIVVIDGLFRDECWEPAVRCLKEDGVLIWDNSDRDDFVTAFKNLQRIGFREISFYGLAPSEFVATQTSVIYRSKNCLGI